MKKEELLTKINQHPEFINQVLDKLNKYSNHTNVIIPHNFNHQFMDYVKMLIDYQYENEVDMKNITMKLLININQKHELKNGNKRYALIFASEFCKTFYHKNLAPKHNFTNKYLQLIGKQKQYDFDDLFTFSKLSDKVINAFENEISELVYI